MKSHNKFIVCTLVSVFLLGQGCYTLSQVGTPTEEAIEITNASVLNFDTKSNDLWPDEAPLETKAEESARESYPRGLMIGLSVTRYDLGSEVRFGDGEVVMAPTLHLGHLSSTGFRLEFGLSYLHDNGDFESWDGLAVSAGAAYPLPFRKVFLRGGIAWFGGLYDEGSADGYGPYVGLGISFDLSETFAVRTDLNVNFWKDGSGSYDGGKGWSLNIGLVWMPKSR
ncbi:MAG: hypothetical protein ACE5IR_21295 [bacterium]